MKLLSTRPKLARLLLILGVLLPGLIAAAKEPIANLLFDERQWPQATEAPGVWVLWTALGVGAVLAGCALAASVLAVRRRQESLGNWPTFGVAGVLLLGMLAIFALGFRAGVDVYSRRERMPWLTAEDRALNVAAAWRAWWKWIWQISEGYVDEKGDFVIEPRSWAAFPFSEGRAVVTDRRTRLHGVIDTEGDWVAEPQYRLTRFHYREGLLAVMTEDRLWGYINREGDEVIPTLFQEAKSFTEGLAAVSSNGKWGYIGPQGDVVIPLMYDGAEAFSEGRAAVNLGADRPVLLDPDDPEGPTGVESGRWGYIDKTGQWVVKPKYVVAFAFEDGKAYVDDEQKGPLWIDRQGRVVAAGQESTAEPAEE